MYGYPGWSPAATDFPFPPTKTGEWRALSRAQREEWLVAARNRHFKWLKRRGGWRDAAPGTIFLVDGAAIGDLPALSCALGEAINGPGGYFGTNLTALEDCLYRAFGVTLPFVLRIQNIDVCRRNLDDRALAAWAREQIESCNFLDEDGKQSLLDDERDGREGKSTLLDTVLDTLLFHGVVIEGSNSLAPGVFAPLSARMNGRSSRGVEPRA